MEKKKEQKTKGMYNIVKHIVELRQTNTSWILSHHMHFEDTTSGDLVFRRK